MEDDKTPMSKELLEHKRLHDYDDQGKGFQQESDDSMWIVAYGMVGMAIVVGIIVVIALIKS